MERNDYPSIMRAAAVMVGLMGIIAVHVMDLPSKFAEVPYLGVGYLAVILVAGALIMRIVSGPTKWDFLASAGLAAAVFAGYAINRTVGMPGATDDIGNWFEPLGLLSLVIEAFVVVAAVWAARAMSSDQAIEVPVTVVERERVLVTS